MDANTTNHILSLSTELMLEIFDYLPPSSSLDIALTCSSLHRRCQPILDAHHAANSKYQVTSDLQPETITDLLKDTPSARLERWHVRELEFWGSRHDWQDWRPFEIELGTTSRLIEGPVSRGKLEEADIDDYILRAHRLWDASYGDFERMRSHLIAGDDAFLKLLLVALCPRLHTIRYVNKAHKSLQWIAKATKWSMGLEQWPPGFESLRHIQVGILRCSLVYEDVESHPNGADFAALLNIPNIESIYCSDLCTDHHEEDDEEDFDRDAKYNVPYRTSSVKRLFLDVTDPSLEFLCSISGASKSLESMVIRAENTHSQYLDDMDSFLPILAKNCPRLEQLVMYNSDGINGHGCAIYPPEELNDFESIKIITIAARSIELSGFYQLSKNGELREPTAEDLGEFVLEAFPSTVEAICIWGESDVYVDSPDPARPSDILDSAIAHLIESGAYENLKAIYLEDVERSHCRKELAFQKSIAAGRKADVHLCTLMNRDDGGYWRNFPARPDWFDLKTGLFGERPADWRFNVLTGEWGPDCEGCGECKECLVVYPPELWKSAARS
ncbi:hypothetical protein ACHAPA_008528 [Fusarium lateritium]